MLSNEERNDRNEQGETGEEENRGEEEEEPTGRRTEEEGGILEAIGETVVEIAQTATHFVAIGKDQKEEGTPARR